MLRRVVALSLSHGRNAFYQPVRRKTRVLYNKMAQSPTWGYCEHNGPSTWKDLAPDAAGQHQSPVNINTTDAIYDKELPANPLQCSHEGSVATTILNNGHTFMVNFANENTNLEGGPLSSKYRLLQLHMHWGKTNDHGAEHTIDTKQYSGEIHLVHWNCDDFEDAGNATTNKGGLAVLCIFVKPGEEHAGFKAITDKLESIEKSGQTSDIGGDGFEPSTLLPENTKDYWTYSGSLTTPPCYETVQFIAFKEPIEVSEEQLNVLRNLKCYGEEEEAYEDEHKGCLLENFRPVQSLNDREIRASFE